MAFWETLASGALGGLAAASILETIKLRVKRKHDQENLCASALIDVASSMRAAGSLYDKLVGVQAPRSLAELVEYPSDFTLRPEAIPLGKYVELLDDHRAIRHAIQMFDALTALAQYSGEHRKACDWLLEKSSWEGPAADERRNRVEHYRVGARYQLARALTHGYRLVADLFLLVRSPAVQYLFDEFGLDKARAEKLAAEYADKVLMEERARRRLGDGESA